MPSRGPHAEGFLELLDARARAALLAAGTERAYPAGRMVFDEGRSAATLAVLLAGRAKISTTTRSGTELLLAIRGPGDLIGELSTLVGEPRSATVRAIDAVRLLVVPQAEFEALLAAHPSMGTALLHMLVARVREADTSRVELERDADARVAGVLARLVDRFGVTGPDGVVRIDLPLSQDELAGLTWTSRGAVAAALRRLRAGGVVRTARRAIEICDPDRLREIAE